MFTDTHCHITYLEERGIDTARVLRSLALKGTPFVLDAGIKAGDLTERIAYVNKTAAAADALGDDAEDDSAGGKNAFSGGANACADSEVPSGLQSMPGAVHGAIDDAHSLRQSIDALFRFAAGIWPDRQAISARVEQVGILEQQFGSCTDGRVCALGECGLDHYWEPDTIDYAGEAELFEMQLALACKLNLPVIVHSRCAFEATLSCIQNFPQVCGVIHCYSYGINEARAFLDAGWYISFSGSVTYAKKAALKDIEDLIRFVPENRLLVETDSPYLAPVPLRGKPNTPLFIEHTYRFIAEKRNASVQSLADTVFKNARALFG